MNNILIFDRSWWSSDEDQVLKMLLMCSLKKSHWCGRLVCILSAAPEEKLDVHILYFDLIRNWVLGFKENAGLLLINHRFLLVRKVTWTQK